MPRKPNWQISSNLAALVIGVLTTFITLAGTAIAQNPVPLVDQPLVPDATAPGGPAFTLTVYGAGFVPTSVVNWNGSPAPPPMSAATNSRRPSSPPTLPRRPRLR